MLIMGAYAVNHCQKLDGSKIWSMFGVGMIQWCFFLLLNVHTSTAESQSDYCQKVKISGTVFQTSREGNYDILDSSEGCEGYPSYAHERGGGFLFYADDDHRWTGWLVGNTNCFNLGGIAVDSSAADPSKVSSHVYWQELNDNIWYINRGLEVTCEDSNGLSEWEIAGIVIACVFVVILIVIVVFCLVKSNQKGSVNSNNTRGHRRNHVSPVSPGTSFWSRTTSAWTTSASSTPQTAPTNIPMEAPRYTPTSNAQSQSGPNPSSGPPPSYQESLEHQVYDLEAIPESNNNTGSDIREEGTQNNDVREPTQANQRPVFSPPPAYSYSVV